MLNDLGLSNKKIIFPATKIVKLYKNVKQCDAFVQIQIFIFQDIFLNQPKNMSKLQITNLKSSKHGGASNQKGLFLK